MMDTEKIPYTYTANNFSEVTSVTIGDTTYTTGYGHRQANYTKLSRYLPPNNSLTFHQKNIETLVSAIILARLNGAL
jgi:hypothetical protein